MQIKGIRMKILTVHLHTMSLCNLMTNFLLKEIFILPGMSPLETLSSHLMLSAVAFSSIIKLVVNTSCTIV